MDEKFEINSEPVGEETKNDVVNEDKGYDRENFANVNYGAEDEPEKEEKHGKKVGKRAVFGIAAALVAAIVVVFLAKVLFFSSADKGLNNMYNSGIGLVDNGWLYHASVDGTQFAKTNIRTGEKVVLKEASVAFADKYKGDLYYYDTAAAQYFRYNESGDDVLIHDGLTLYPFFDGNYVYYLTADSAYGGFVRRTPLKGGEEEIVLNVYTSYFTIESGNIIYFDPAINDLLIVKLSDALAYAKDSEGEAAESADIKAVVLLEDTVTTSVNVRGRYVYYTDADDDSKIKRLDMSSGEITSIGHGIMGNYINVYGKHIYYVSPSDNRIYRCNLDGSDIRDLTGTNYYRTAGISVYDGYMVYYALVGYYDDNMQTQYEPVIVVAEDSGRRICEIPGNGGMDKIDETEQGVVTTPNIEETPEPADENAQADESAEAAE